MADAIAKTVIIILKKDFLDALVATRVLVIQLAQTNPEENQKLHEYNNELYFII